MVSPFAAAVEGFFQGREWRDRKDDRARQREREDEIFGWRKEDRDISREERERRRQREDADRAWTRETRDQTRAEWEREEAERERKKEEGQLLLEAWGLGGETEPAPANESENPAVSSRSEEPVPPRTQAPPSDAPPAPTAPPREQSPGIGPPPVAPQQPPAGAADSVRATTREPGKPRTPDPWADRMTDALPPTQPREMAGRHAPQRGTNAAPSHRPAQPPGIGLDVVAEPGTPPASPSVPPNGRFTRMAREIGGDPQMMRVAEQADMAEQALLDGVDPSTGQRFTPEDRQAVEDFVRDAAEQLAAEHHARSQAGTMGPGPVPPEVVQRGDQTAAAFDSARLRDTDTRPITPRRENGPIAGIRPEQPPSIGVMADYPRIKTEPAEPPRDFGMATEGQGAGGAGAGGPAETVAPTQQTPSGTPEESVETAKEAVVDVGVKGARPTARQADRMEKAFMQDYDSRRSKKLLRFYLQNGEIEKAVNFREWLKQKDVRTAMGHWSRAIMAATYGDEKEFVSQITKAYNQDGYYDDGYSIDPEESGFARDDAGRVIPGRAQVTFINDRTGERFTQTFEGEEDLYRMGINRLSAEEVFERGWSEYQAGRAAREKARPKDSDILKAIEMLSDKFLNPEGATEFNLLSPAEKRQRAVEMLTGQGGATGPAPDQVPVYGGE